MKLKTNVLWIVSYLDAYRGFKTKKDAQGYIDWLKRIGARGVPSSPEKFCKG